MSDPLLDPVPPPHGVVPTPGLWRNGAFLRVWSAATISVFGSFVTRIALPFVAILALEAGPIDVAILRSLELVAALLVGFVAGAWVDRLRRRPVLIWADILRALLLGSIPLAALGGWLTLAQVFVVAALAAVCTTFFDVADRAYLPTIVERSELVRANSALTATSSAVEFAAFGVAGFLVTLLTAPFAILIDAVSFVISAVILGTIRRPEPPPPPVADRESVTREIAEGLRVVLHDPVLRGMTAGAMGISGAFGIFATTWLLFVTEDLRLDPGVIGVVAAIGGIGSLVGALLAERTTGRFGIGPVMVVAMLFTALGSLLIPLAPVALPLVAIALLLGQQVLGDTAVTIYDVSQISVRQSVVPERQLGRVNATVRVAMVVAQLAATLIAGVLAEVIGLRGTLFLAPVAALVGALLVWRSPVRHLRAIAPGEPAGVDPGVVG